MEARSVTLQGRVTAKEKAMVEKHCERRGEPVSDYVRSAVFTLNPVAWRVRLPGAVSAIHHRAFWALRSRQLPNRRLSPMA